MEYFSDCTNIRRKTECVPCKTRVWRQQYISKISALSPKDILYSNSYTLAYRYARENGHFYEKLARRAHERRSRRYCSEPRERRPNSRETFHWRYHAELFSRSLESPLIVRIFTMIIGTAAGVIKERRTRWPPPPPPPEKGDFFSHEEIQWR